MLPKFVTLSAIVLASQVGAAVGETSDRFWYTAKKGVPQNVNASDVVFIVKCLRSYGRQVKPGRFLSMKSADTKGCGEWSVYSRGSAMVSIKHVNDTIDSFVLFEDLATTINGGEKTTPEEQQKALLGCGTDGGAVAVQVNLTNSAYTPPHHTSLQVIRLVGSS